MACGVALKRTHPDVLPQQLSTVIKTLLVTLPIANIPKAVYSLELVGDFFLSFFLTSLVLFIQPFLSHSTPNFTLTSVEFSLRESLNLLELPTRSQVFVSASQLVSISPCPSK